VHVVGPTVLIYYDARWTKHPVTRNHMFFWKIIWKVTFEYFAWVYYDKQTFLIFSVTNYQKGLWPSKLVQAVVILTCTLGFFLFPVSARIPSILSKKFWNNFRKHNMLKDKFWFVLQLAWNVEWKPLYIEPRTVWQNFTDINMTVTWIKSVQVSLEFEILLTGEWETTENEDLYF
jgi:hypothetical protein